MADAQIFDEEVLASIAETLSEGDIIWVRWRLQAGHAPQLWKGVVAERQDEGDDFMINFFEGPRGASIDHPVEGYFPREDVEYFKIGIIASTDDHVMLQYTPDGEPTQVDVTGDGDTARFAEDPETDALEREHIGLRREHEALKRRVAHLEKLNAAFDRQMGALQSEIDDLRHLIKEIPLKAGGVEPQRPKESVDQIRARLRAGVTRSGAPASPPRRHRSDADHAEPDPLVPETWPVRDNQARHFVLSRLRTLFVDKAPRDHKKRANEALAFIEKKLEDRAEQFSISGTLEGQEEYWQAVLEDALFELRVETEARRAGVDLAWLRRQRKAAVQDDVFAALLAEAPVIKETKKSDGKKGKDQAAKDVDEGKKNFRKGHE